MDAYILNLEDVSRTAVQVVGGKAALLGELITGGYPVPKGFVITTTARDEFLSSAGLEKPLAAFSNASTEAQMQQAADDLSVLIADAPLPADLAVGLSTLYRALGSRPKVAVRPSVAFHDGLLNPAAGKLVNFLNVVGEKDLFQAIRNVWAGAWDPVIMSSFRRRELDHGDLKVAILVQVMVRPLSSGTILTADPVSGDRDKLMITAGWGMKQESISGQVMPDTYHVDRETMALRYKRIVTKELMVAASGLVPVPKNRKNAVVLKDVAIRDLCQMAIGIEDTLGGPAEVEWCVLQGGAIQVLQVAPIDFEDDVEIAPLPPRAVVAPRPDQTETPEAAAHTAPAKATAEHAVAEPSIQPADAPTDGS